MLTVVHKNPICSFNANWLADIVDQYLRFELWDPEKTYPPGTLFYLNVLDFGDRTGYNFCAELVDRGFRVIIDNLWEVDPGPVPNTHRIVCDAWFWYNESLWYQHLGYDRYQPARAWEHLALMPMNKRKPHRDDFVQRINLDRMLWSYVAAGRQLPGDGDMTDWNTQRYMNPDWYDQTYMSMVVESLVRPGSKYTPCFVTEKTMKPLAFQHPFLVYGNRGTLRTLKNWGFETWSHLWDESYDEIQQADERGRVVAALLNSIEVLPHTPETLKKLQHNRNHFFDSALIRRGIIKEIVEPIIEYAEINR
jgi:hypothetical protein